MPKIKKKYGLEYVAATYFACIFISPLKIIISTTNNKIPPFHIIYNKINANKSFQI